MLYLTVKGADGTTVGHTLDDDENILGRDVNASLRLDDRNVSSQHARIFWENCMYWCEDGYDGQVSRNGTWVNGKRINGKVPLEKGDELLIGTFQITISDLMPPLHADLTEEIPGLKGKEKLTPEDFHQLQLSRLDEKIKNQYHRIGIAAGGLLLLILLIAWLVWPSSPPALVRVAHIVQRSTDPLFFSGFALPGRNFAFEAPDYGKILKLYKKEGDFVKKGEIIAQLENPQLQHAVTRLKNKFAMMQTQLRGLQGKKMPALQRRYDKAQAQFNELHSRVALAIKQKSPKLEELKPKYSKAKKYLQQVRELRDKLQKELQTLPNQIIIARSEYKASEWRFQELTMKSPLNGRIKQLTWLEGSYIPKGKALCQIVDMSTVKVYIEIPVNDFPNWQHQQKLPVFFKELPDLSFNGVVLSITFRDSVVNEEISKNPVSEVIIDIKNPQGKIRAGMTAHIKHYPQNVTPGFFMPSTALVPHVNYPAVYIVRKNKCYLQKVEIKNFQEAEVVVTQGLHEGDFVIISPAQTLQHGQAVNVISK